jgi:methyl-accepting chemotaxis protein
MIVRKLLNLVARHSIAAKLTAMAVTGALFMVLVALTVLFIARAELGTERIEKAHAIVDAVWSIADSFKHAVDSGAMTEEEARARFLAASGAIWFEGHTNYVFMYDTDTGLCVINTGNPDLVGKDLRGLKDSKGVPFASMMLDIARRGEGTVRYEFPKGAGKIPLEKVAYVRGFGTWHLMIASAEYMTDLDATLWQMTRTVAAVIGILLLCSIGIAWTVSRSVVKPLSRLKSRMAALSKGDLDFEAASVDRHDEIGEMARTVEVFVFARSSQTPNSARRNSARRIWSSWLTISKEPWARSSRRYHRHRANWKLRPALLPPPQSARKVLPAWSRRLTRKA